jgi:hypothetical protein
MDISDCTFESGEGRMDGGDVTEEEDMRIDVI